MDKQLLKKISQIREKGNFQTLKKEVGEERLKEFINSIYPKFSITEIEKITGIPDSTLGHWFNRLEIPFIRNHISCLSLPSDTDSEVVIGKDNVTKKIQSVKITPELSYLIGFSLGDGNIQRYNVDIFNKDIKLREVFLNIIQKYGSITEYVRPDKLWRLRLSSGRIANLIKNENKIRKDTIDFIFNREKLAKKFIAGFWDAEGSVWYTSMKPNYYHIYLFNSNKYLLEKIKEFLRSKGIDFSLLNKNPIDRKMKDGRIIKSKKIVERVSIPKSSSIKWAMEIGVHMNHSNKSNNVKKLLQGENKND